MYCYFILTVVQWTINLAPYNCMGAGWGVREVGWKHEWRVTSDHTALCPHKHGCLLGMVGVGGGGTKEWRLDHGYCQKKTGETVDRHQNNGSVTAVSPRHCAATSALCNCCLNCRAWAESQRQLKQQLLVSWSHQVSSWYNITLIYTNQVTVGSPQNQTHWCEHTYWTVCH